MRVVWQVESDPYARAVLRKHWPHAALYDDVRSVGAANLAPVDLVCGGFPCQDISNAGKRVGIDGERSGLWSEYARIVRELRPRYVLVENVAALLARGLERVVGDLAACGYDAEWDCFPASAFGAPHQRDRLFVVAYPVRDGRDLRRRTEGNLPHEQRDSARQVEQRDRREHRARADGQTLADDDFAGLEGRYGGELRESPGKRSSRQVGAFPDAAGAGRDGARSVLAGAADRAGPFGQPARSDWWDVEPDVCGMADGVSKGLHNAGSGLDSEEDQEGRFAADMRVLRLLVGPWLASQRRRSEQQRTRELANALRRLSHKASLERRKEGLAQTPSFMHGLRQACEALGVVRDASEPLLAAWISLPEEDQAWAVLCACRGPWVMEWPRVQRVSRGVPSRVDRLTCLGNAVVPQVAEWIGRQILAHAEEAMIPSKQLPLRGPGKDEEGGEAA